MADNLTVTPGSGASIGMDEVADGTLGTVKVGFGKIMDGTLNSTNKLVVNASGEAQVKADDTDALLTTIDADTGNISTKIDTVAGAVSGTEMQVDVVTSALPTGAATSTIQTDGTQKTRISDGSQDNIMLADNSDAAAASATANKISTVDRNTIWNSNSAAWNRARAVENATDSTGTGIAASGMMAQFDDTTPGTVTENRFGNVRMSVRREVYNQIRDAAGNERGANVTAAGELNVLETNSAAIKTAVETIDNAISGSEMQVDVVAALPAGNNNIGDVDIASIAAGDNNIGNVDIVTLPGDVEADIDQIRDQIDLITPDIEEIRVDADAIRVATELIDDAISTDDTSTHTPATTKAMNVAYVADETSTDSVNEGDIGMARMTLDRKQVVTLAPSATTEGWDSANFTSGDTFTALTNSAQPIKASAGKFGGYYIYNPNSSATYVIVYNVAHGSVTVGTTTPKLVFCIPATSGANLELTVGIAFDTAMSIAATTTGGGNTAPTTALEAMVWYK